jgi:hypothetical protein
MPSPFPGMDPYLEKPSLWPDVHHEIISVTRAMLTRLLRPKYAVLVEERVYLAEDNDPARETRIPDVKVALRPTAGSTPASLPSFPGVAITAPVAVPLLDAEEVREAYLTIIDHEGQKVITVIEILSPSNKLPGSAGYDSYRTKRREIMSSATHLVEIDLLRQGRPAYPKSGILNSEYQVHVCAKRPRREQVVWPIKLRERLPVLGVPLNPEDQDAPLDLQEALDTAYDRAGYDLVLDYSRDPEPPLAPEHRQWMEELLRAKGLRP